LLLKILYRFLRESQHKKGTISGCPFGDFGIVGE
jgi:xanthine dehydrogenase iron-sulfur cluster and FAD-binding subunit A